MSRIVRAALALAVIAAGSVALAQQPAQAPPLPPNTEETQLFRGLFHFHKIEPVADPGAIGDYSKLIVVILGDPHNQGVTQAARAALSNGGAVLIAASSTLDLKGYFPGVAEVSVSGFRVIQPAGPAPEPRNAGPMIQFTRVPVVPRLTTEIELFTPFQRIEAELPSYLEIGKRPAHLKENVAGFSRNATDSRTGRPIGDKPFAAAGAGDDRNPFRCVVMADAGVFSNRMIYTSAPNRGATDNFRFANALVQWLKGPQGRTHCLFVENGRVMDKFDDVKYASIPTGPPVPPMPVPPVIEFIQKLMQGDVEAQQQLADNANQMIARVEDENVFNNALADTNEKKAAVYRTLAVLGLLLLYALTRMRALRQRFLALFRPIPKDPLRLGAETAVGSLEHRRLEMLRGGDYGLPVRGYVRTLFEERGLPTGYAADKLPPVEFDLRNTDFLKKAIRTLWDEARSAKPINYSRWKQLEPLLAGVRAAADDDRWRFVPPDDRGAA